MSRGNPSPANAVGTFVPIGTADFFFNRLSLYFLLYQIIKNVSRKNV